LIYALNKLLIDFTSVEGKSISNHDSFKVFNFC